MLVDGEDIANHLTTKKILIHTPSIQVHNVPLCTREHDPNLASFAILVAMDPEKSATKVVFPGAKNKFLCQQWRELPVQQGSLWSLKISWENHASGMAETPLSPSLQMLVNFGYWRQGWVFFNHPPVHMSNILWSYLWSSCVFLSHFEMKTCLSSIKQSTQQRGRKRYKMEGPKSWSFLLYHCP